MEHISPVSKKVDRADGLKLPTANRTITTPDPTFGYYSGDNEMDNVASHPDTLFGVVGKNSHSDKKKLPY